MRHGLGQMKSLCLVFLGSRVPGHVGAGGCWEAFEILVGRPPGHWPCSLQTGYKQRSCEIRQKKASHTHLLGS